MKKIMIVALVAMIATSAFAQNPEALKQIKKEKSADAVKSLIEANESSMSAAENAQAYDKLVDIYMKRVTSIQSAMQMSDIEKSMGLESKEDTNTSDFYDCLKGAFESALLCDKYDSQPNDKGKVAPKFRKANAERLYSLRPYLINAGQEAQSNEDNDKAGDFYALYVITAKSDLFAEQEEAAKKAAPDGVADPYLSEVARVASLTAFNKGDTDKAMELADIMLEDTDPEEVEEGLSLKMYYTEKGLKTKEDSLKCLETYKELFEKYPQSQDVFSRLASMYGNLGQTDKQNALIAQFLQENPNNFTAWAMKGQAEMNEKDYDAAITDLKKSLECDGADDGQRALANTFIGYCYSQKATQLDAYEQQIDMLKEGIPYLESARALDPNRDRCNWAYPLYNCYYHIKGENDPATEELRNLLGL